MLRPTLELLSKPLLLCLLALLLLDSYATLLEQLFPLLGCLLDLFLFAAALVLLSLVYLVLQVLSLSLGLLQRLLQVQKLQKE